MGKWDLEKETWEPGWEKQGLGGKLELVENWKPEEEKWGLEEKKWDQQELEKEKWKLEQ